MAAAPPRTALRPPHLLSPPAGGQVGQAAAGHRAEPLPEPLLLLLLLPPRAPLLPTPEPGEGEGQAGGGGAHGARRRHAPGANCQVAVGAPPARAITQPIKYYNDLIMSDKP